MSNNSSNTSSKMVNGGSDILKKSVTGVGALRPGAVQGGQSQQQSSGATQQSGNKPK